MSHRVGYTGRRVARDANEKPIVAALKAVGATVEHLETPCDLLVGFRGRDFKLEVKRPKERLTEAQEKFAREWRGAPIFVVRSERDALFAIGAIG